MKGYIFLLTMLLLSFNLVSQNRRYYDVESAARIKDNYGHILFFKGTNDSLLMNNNVYYFKESPMDYLSGAEKMLYDNIMVLPEIDAGYRLRWSIEEGKLYIRAINICRSDYDTNMKPTKEEANKKLEVFLGREFDECRLFADFVTGKFVLYKYPLTLRACGEKSNKYTTDELNRYREYLMKKQEIYTVEFELGVLTKLSRNKSFERKFRKNLKPI